MSDIASNSQEEDSIESNLYGSHVDDVTDHVTFHLDSCKSNLSWTRSSPEFRTDSCPIYWTHLYLKLDMTACTVNYQSDDGRCNIYMIYVMWAVLY